MGHALWEIYKKRVDPCRYYNTGSLFHAGYKKAIENGQSHIDYALGGEVTLGISGWGCAAGTLEPLAYTRASSAEFC